MKQISAKKWIIFWLLCVSILVATICISVYTIDPYFHYHKPLSNSYFYELDWQRYQNDGICRNFEYDALITGTSMTENFKVSEMNDIFGVNAIKVCYSGGSYKEIHDCIDRALKYNPKLKTIVRGLDMAYFHESSDNMRIDLGEYPTYLYDRNPLNDAPYLLSRTVLGRIWQMVSDTHNTKFAPGVTSFDEYSNWMTPELEFGREAVLASAQGFKQDVNREIEARLGESERELIIENITINVTSLADEYPDVDFYCFFPPYSIVWWKNRAESGTIAKQVEAEKTVIELILEYPNIHLYSFNNKTDITTNLDNYKDSTHYGAWINSLILEDMHNNDGLLTKENYLDYLKQEQASYESYDYDGL